jgi:DNA-binding transcriptional LysR family regulator
MTTVMADWERRIGRRVRLRDLHILSTVVQWGSMAKAAASLGVSQPSVSEAIANLEAALRVRLLDRSARGVEPTMYARALLKRGQVVFDELQQGIRDIEHLSDPTTGEVAIGCPESLMAGFVPAVIDRLSRQYPQVIIRVIHAESGSLEFRELRERKIDLMLGRVSGPVDDYELEAEILFEDQHFVVAGALSRWARRRKIDLAELVNEPWIHLPSDTLIGSLIAEVFQGQDLKMPRESVTTFSMQIRSHLLATGHFLTIMPRSMLHFNSKAWLLKALPVKFRIQPRSVAAVTLKNRTVGPVTKLFIEHARAVTKSMHLSSH